MSCRFALFALFLFGCIARGAPAEQKAVDDGTISIMDLRDPSSPNHPALGSQVVVRGGIITDVKMTGNARGFFMQDPHAKTFAAVYVLEGDDDVSDFEPGDEITKLMGTYSQYLGMDVIDNRLGGYESEGGHVVPEPIDVTVGDLEPGGDDALESMLVRVTEVVATSDTVHGDFTIGEDRSAAHVDVTSYMANDIGPSPFPAVAGQRFAYIIGHPFVDDVAHLAPMSADDVQLE
ncbi:MAG TPA: hypothetical protein VGH28_21460 [Polyangiaceae bacterium]|jgi:hypothetical protein